MAAIAEVVRGRESFYSLRIRNLESLAFKHPEGRPDTPVEITLVNGHGFEFRRIARKSGFIDYERAL